MADPEHLAVVRQGTGAIAEWRESHPDVRLDLIEADLSEADLFRANLTRANLSVANLIGADLTGAILTGANLIGVDLTMANLIGANLTGAKLTSADLTMANLTGADLTRANLFGADLTGAILTWANLFSANLTKARCFFSVFADCDLSQAVGLGEVAHGGPSTIGVDTIIRTARSQGGGLSPETKGFFTGAGVQEATLDAILASIREIKYDSCFISYGSPDLEFATKLENDLKERGVSCWKFDTNAVPGRPLGGEIRKRRREAEKFVVTCSVKSLIRKPVTKEIEEQVDEDPNKIIPVSLDNIWTEPGFRVHGPTKDLKDFLLNNVWASFAGWEKDPERYQQGLERLLKGLERGAAEL